MLLKEIKEQMNKDIPSLVYAPLTPMYPANSHEELQELVKREQMIVALQAVSECNLSRTVITMMKMLMTRALAMEFSMTGLGDKRRPCKIKFDNSPACFLVERSVGLNPLYSREPRSAVKAAIRNALKGATDWDGHRGRRLNAAAAADLGCEAGASTSAATTSGPCSDGDQTSSIGIIQKTVELLAPSYIFGSD
ncbi:uncharacterized protein LOC125178040 [Hyalella azteca]|uniref:Uncharacterized protein LOC125178040 n=1 Tax=Hyalella azteca TaxID=294128 RepID=A0A979FK21_HYAAZ|nr:uncharacterized protein LOC125178040 [Hyalella azteca]